MEVIREVKSKNNGLVSALLCELTDTYTRGQPRPHFGAIKLQGEHKRPGNDRKVSQVMMNKCALKKSLDTKSAED